MNGNLSKKTIEEYEEMYALEKIGQRLKKIECLEPTVGYCPKLGGNCKYMQDGACIAAVCERRTK